MKFDCSCIIPECYADTNLVQTLLQMRGANHQKSCGQVTNELQSKFKDQFAVGIIDLDKKQSDYSEESVEIARSTEITVCRHPKTHHYLIKINNVLESFIVNCAKEVGVDLSPLGLPFEVDALMKRTKKQEAKNDPELSNYFKKLTSSKEMSLLKDVLEYLYNSTYAVKDNELIQIFQNHGFMNDR